MLTAYSFQASSLRFWGNGDYHENIRSLVYYNSSCYFLVYKHWFRVDSVVGGDYLLALMLFVLYENVFYLILSYAFSMSFQFYSGLSVLFSCFILLEGGFKPFQKLCCHSHFLAWILFPRFCSRTSIFALDVPRVQISSCIKVTMLSFLCIFIACACF